MCFIKQLGPRFLLAVFVVVGIHGGFVSLNSALNMHGVVQGFALEETDTTTNAPEDLNIDDDAIEDQQQLVLVNNTGAPFWIYRFDHDDEEITNLHVGDGQAIALEADETDFYVNVGILGDGLGLVSFGVDGQLIPGNTYSVVLYDRLDGQALFDENHHPVWHMRFTEIDPAPGNGQPQHVFIKSHRK